MHNRKFSPKVKKIIQLSREEAIRLGHDFIGTEHFLLGMLQEKDSLPVKVLDSLEVNLEELKHKIELTQTKRSADEPVYNFGSIPLNKHAEKVLKV
ncbi:MAG: Clp protease N-terminal domain-containing protein, partial [Saprospiraceae bacterium]